MNEIAVVERPIPVAALGEFDAARAAIARAARIDEVLQIKDRFEAIRGYLKQQRGSLDMQNQATAIKIRADRRLSALTRDLHTAGNGRPSQKPVQAAQVFPVTWDELRASEGINRRSIGRWHKEAEPGEETLDAYIAHCTVDGEEATTAGFLRFASESAGGYDGNEWYTPAAEVEAVRRVLGGIDLDPASCAYAQRTVKAARFFAKAHNPLAREWPGRVFLNPPYSYPEVEQFTARMVDQYDAGMATAAIILVNNCTDAKWFQALLGRFPVCFTAGRIAFEREGAQKFQTRQGQAFFYLGADLRLFIEVFDGPIGFVVQRPNGG